MSGPVGESAAAYGGAEASTSISPRAYDYFTFTSDTTTRSGYQVTRRNYAVAVQDRTSGLVYALVGRAARADLVRPPPVDLKERRVLFFI